MIEFKWDWITFFLALIALVAIQFLQEYKAHKKINFSEFKKYTKVFWVFNVIYILLGGFFAVIFSSIIGTQDPLSPIIYAGSWEGILGNLLSKKEEDKNETP